MLHLSRRQMIRQDVLARDIAPVRITPIALGVSQWCLCARMQVLSCISSFAESY